MLHDSQSRNIIRYRFSLFCYEPGKNHVMTFMTFMTFMTNCQESDVEISCASSEPELEEVI